MLRPKRTELNRQSLSYIGIPPKFHEIDLSDFEAPKKSKLLSVKDSVEKYIDDIDLMFSKNVGIFFTGSNGVGKTMLSCIILKSAYIHRYSCRRTTFTEYLAQYTRLWDSHGDERDLNEDTFYNNYKAVEFLILEEVGKEIDTKIAVPILEDLLRYREDKSLVTIICTNLNMEAFKHKYGESCYSLLKGNMFPIEIDQSDYRSVEFKDRLEV